jgi:hypothetical protein
VRPRLSYLLAVVGLAPVMGLLPVPVWLRVAVAITFVLAMFALSARYGEEIEGCLEWLEFRIRRKGSSPRRVDLHKKLLKVGAACIAFVSVASLVLAVSIGPPTGLPGDIPPPAAADRSRITHASGLQAVLGVANVTAQDDTYYPYRIAKVDQVAKAHLSVRNLNSDGKSITVIRIALNMPQKEGKTQKIGQL